MSDNEGHCLSKRIDELEVALEEKEYVWQAKYDLLIQDYEQKWGLSMRQSEQIVALKEREEDLVRNCARANAEKEILQVERDKWKAGCTCIVPDDYDADCANKKFGDRYGYDWEYRGATTLKAIIAEKDSLVETLHEEILALETGQAALTAELKSRCCCKFDDNNQIIISWCAHHLQLKNNTEQRIKELQEGLEKIFLCSDAPSCHRIVEHLQAELKQWQLALKVQELEESRDEWKRQWQLTEARNKAAEDRIKELTEALEKIETMPCECSQDCAPDSCDKMQEIAQATLGGKE
jgi:hypothetical protein